MSPPFVAWSSRTTVRAPAGDPASRAPIGTAAAQSRDEAPVQCARLRARHADAQLAVLDGGDVTVERAVVGDLHGEHLADEVVLVGLGRAEELGVAAQHQPDAVL